MHLRCLLPLAVAILSACEGGEAPPPGLSATAQAGWRTYRMFCVACHARDPNADSALGPPVAGSSRELIEARLLRAGYPPGYTPKRDSRIMPAHPHLARDIDALAAYLGEIKPR